MDDSWYIGSKRMTQNYSIRYLPLYRTKKYWFLAIYFEYFPTFHKVPTVYEKIWGAVSLCARVVLKWRNSIWNSTSFCKNMKKNHNYYSLSNLKISLIKVIRCDSLIMNLPTYIIHWRCLHGKTWIQTSPSTALQLLLDFRSIDVRGFNYPRLIFYLLLVTNLLS